IKTNGIDYSGSASALTAADGSFRVAVRRGGLATLDVTFYRNGKPITTTVNVGPYTADFTLTPCIVTEPAPLEITARLLPSGIVGTAYNARLAASNGTKPYSWSVASGALPTGLTLAGATGQISGTPTTEGVFTVTIQAQDSSAPQQTATRQFTIAINGSTETVSRVAAGIGHTCALMSKGTVWCWGYNGYGQLGNGTITSSSTPVMVSGITTATAIAAADLHTCAVLNNGTVQCWGYNVYGQLGNGTTTVYSSIPVPVIGLPPP
ncbi:MAG: putative Ig domain-containing protein, partial [Planctomycetota bacterium]